MKAAVYRSYGPPEVLKIEEVPAPTVKPEEDGRLLIKVHSASVNPFDYLYRKGYLPVRISEGLLKPKSHILGIDVAGTVEAVSDNVTKFNVGDRVFGSCFGSHAEYVRVRESSLSLLPANATFQQAAALPCAALTAVQALRDVAHIQPGQKMAVYGASGGIGHFAVQLAKYFGAQVTAVCSTANLDWVKALGADCVVDYTREDFAKRGQIYDLILDAVGKRTYYNCKPALAPTGVYISEHLLTPRYHPLQYLLSSIVGDKRPKVHLAEPNAEDMNLFRELVEAGKLAPVIDRTYPLDQIVEAHRYVEQGHSKGKVIIEVHPS